MDVRRPAPPPAHAGDRCLVPPGIRFRRRVQDNRLRRARHPGGGVRAEWHRRARAAGPAPHQDTENATAGDGHGPRGILGLWPRDRDDGWRGSDGGDAVTVLLEVNEAHVHFGGVRAVDGVSFKIEAGVLYGLVGPNGSGKSTLLGALSRMTNMTGGRIEFEGKHYTRAPLPGVARMGISRTFQAVRLLPERTVLENVMLGGDARVFGRSI